MARASSSLHISHKSPNKLIHKLHPQPYLLIMLPRRLQLTKHILNTQRLHIRIPINIPACNMETACTSPSTPPGTSNDIPRRLETVASFYGPPFVLEIVPAARESGGVDGSEAGED